jgi:hypothetical protein
MVIAFAKYTLQLAKNVTSTFPITRGNIYGRYDRPAQNCTQLEATLLLNIAYKHSGHRRFTWLVVMASHNWVVFVFAAQLDCHQDSQKTVSFRNQ